MRTEGPKLVLIMVAFSVLLVQAQDQQGFISLDCGLPPNQSPYTEPTTGLIFTSDADFIQSGTRGKIENELSVTYKQYNALRYFPDGIRNCYNLNVKQGVKYLIRAGFAYGNYDGHNIYPGFDIYIGTNLWASVSFKDELFIRDIIDFEIIHMAKSNSLQICLVKTGTDTPLISTLELRPLRNDSYSTQFGSLKLIGRQFRDYTIPAIVRYPDDAYDRQWNTYLWFSGAKEINTTLSVNSSNPFALPDVIARAATTPQTAKAPLMVYGDTDNPGDNVVFYFHFAEIQVLGANEIREFDIVWDDNITIPAYRPKMLQMDTIFNALPKKCEYGSCELELVRNPKSTLPPLLSASEIYEYCVNKSANNIQMKVKIKGTKVLIIKETSHKYPIAFSISLTVVAIKNIQAAYRLSMISWQGDPCLPEHLNWKGVDCSYDRNNKSTPPRIISLDLPSMELKGIIAPALQNLTQLQKLDLSSNNLTGGVPEFLANMKSLMTINLSFNRLKGPIPQALHDRENNGLKLITQGNPDLCSTDKCKISNTKFLVPLVASLASVVLIVAVLIFIFCRKKKKPNVRRRSPFTKSQLFTKKRRFTYADVEAMTNNFERVLGEGGFGIVYHGSFDDTEQVAVKVLSHSSIQGYKQFKAEVELLLRVHHVNLISIVGYCNEDDHLALVYEYASNGDLRQSLTGESGSSGLNWGTRLRIATETAQGLEYLHTGSDPPMIHRDVKTSNILMDEHLQAKLADFGLSRSFATGTETHMSTNVAGTPGYLDPEYYRTNWLTEKSDVYSFGIVLLEMITCQPVIQQTREKPHIASWVGYMLGKGDIESIMDPNLKGDYDSSCVWRVLELAMSCVNPTSSERPTMSEVVSELKDFLLQENSKKEETADVEPKSSLEPSRSITSEVNPDVR